MAVHEWSWSVFLRSISVISLKPYFVLVAVTLTGGLHSLPVLGLQRRHPP